VELVTDYLEGTLPEEDRVRFEAHLAECEGSSGYLEDMRRLIGRCTSYPSRRPTAPRTMPWCVPSATYASPPDPSACG